MKGIINVMEYLKEYLEIIWDMEKNLFLRKNLLEQKKKTCAQLGEARQFQKPLQPILKDTERTPEIKTEKDEYIGSIISVLIGIPVVAWGFNLLSGNSILGFLGGLLVLLIGGMFVLIACILLIKGFSDTSTAKTSNYQNEQEYQKQKEAHKKQYEQEKILYEKNLAEYMEATTKDQSRVYKENIHKKFLELEIYELDKQIVSSQEKLSIMYDKNVIYPKYRNLVAISSIYEYFASERCSTLGDAYNLFESEIRLDRIILQLDHILSSLEDIKNNQYTLYAGIQDMNRQMQQMNINAENISQKIDSLSESVQDISTYDDSRIIEQLKELQNNSAETSYHTERMQKELEYMNRMHYYSGKYDGSGWITPTPPM